MRTFRMMWAIARRSNLHLFLIGFVICFFIGALLIFLLDPNYPTYGNAVWYLFVACTSIGFGDFVPVTLVGRLVTIFMTIFEILLVAMFSGVVVSNYLELVKIREKETVTVFLDKLEHLTELNKEELEEIQEKVRNFKKYERERDKIK